MNGVRLSASLLALAFSLSLAACSEDVDSPAGVDQRPSLGKAGGGGGGDAAAAILAMMDEVNAGLAAEGADYRVGMAEFLTSVESGEIGVNTVIAKDVGNKQLAFDFVPFDGRRPWSAPPGITYAVDPFDGFATGPVLLPPPVTTAEIDAAMATWDGVNCATIPVVSSGLTPIDIGIIEFIITGGASGAPFPLVFGDVEHAGWGAIDGFLGPGIIGAAFTFFFPVPGDIDNNGKLDAAFREIYYNDFFFPWAISPGAVFSPIDVQTVAAHEAGHGLSQDHFGKVFIRNDGSIKASPPALMNAVYLGQQQTLLGTDVGGHCSNWAQWPNN